MNRHERRKQAKLASQTASRPSITLPKAPAPSAPTVIAHYGTPSTLVVLGPLIQGIWGPPPALIAAFQAAGRPVPPVVPGYFLIDTGATKTCIAVAVAKQLQLNRIGFTNTLGAGGVTRHEVYFGHIAISVPDSFGNVTLVEADREAAALPDLDKSLNPKLVQNITRPNFPAVVIGLLGRDFLQYTTLTYHGSSGVVELVLDLAAVQRVTKTTPGPTGPP